MRKRTLLISVIIICFILSVVLHAKTSNLNLTPEERNYIKNNKYINIGFSENEPFIFIKNEEVKGLIVEIFSEMSKALGVSFSYKRYKNIENRMEALQRNEVDILTAVIYNEKLEEKIAFGYPKMKVVNSIFTKESNLERNSLHKLKDKKVALLNKLGMNNLLIEQFPNVNFVLADSIDEMFFMLDADKVDAVIMEKILGSYKVKKLKISDIITSGDIALKEEVNGHTYVTTNENKVLLSILNKAYMAISKNRIFELWQKWLFNYEIISQFEDNNLNLSIEELDYLNTKEYISVTALESFQPFSFYKDGKVEGYSIEIMRLIGELLNKEIRFVQKPWNEQLEMLEAGKLDVIPHIAITNERKEFITYTDFIHLSFLTGFITNKTNKLESMDDLSGKKLAIINKYFFQNYLEKTFPEIEFIIVKSGIELIEAVSQGDAFASIGNLPTLNYFIQAKWANNLKTITVKDFGIPIETEMPMGVKKGNLLLKSILEKANLALPIEEVKKIKQKWLESENKTRKIELSEEEKAYLRDKKEILMCIDPNWMPFEANINGKHIGMSADYFELFEEMIDTPIKLVETDICLKSFENGKKKEYDIFSLLMETEEKKKHLDFTKNYFETSLVLATEMDGKWVESLDALKGKKIGIVKGYVCGEILRKKYPSLNLLEVENIHEGLLKVEKSEIDGFIGSLATVGHHIQEAHVGMVKISGRFDEIIKMGIGIRKDEPLLKSIFNKAIDSLTEEDHRKIRNKWIKIEVNKGDNNELSLQEKRFLEKHPKIRFRIRNDRAPFEFNQNGQAAGLAVDYLTTIADRVGLQAEFVVDDTGVGKSFEILNTTRDKFDTLAYSVKSANRENYLVYGDVYMSYPMMIITNKNSPYIGKTSDLIGKTVAIEKGFLTQKWLERDYAGINIMEVESTKTALQLVNDAKVDAYIGNLAVANFMMVHGGMSNLKVQAPSDYGNVDYRFVAPKDWPELASILNKGYNQLTVKEHSLIQQKWFSLQVIEKFDYDILTKGAIISVAFMALILYWNRRLQFEKKKTQTALEELKKVSVRDKLTSLFNRIRTDEVLLDELERAQRFKEAFGVILLDVDLFKVINDDYGHQTGDKVLIEFAKLLKENFRDVDTIGRWGGEEFIVICPETDKLGTIYAAEKVRRIIEKNIFNEVGKVTASFGCTIYNNDENVDEIIQRADDALYNSKKSGRNIVSFK